MEAESVAAPRHDSPLAALRATIRDRPWIVAVAVLVVIAALLLASFGLRLFAQRTVNGLVAGTYFALGAVGLTLVYGILKLVNFAHGDMLTFGAYIAFFVNVSLGMPLPFAILGAVAVTALLGVAFEMSMWRPMRRKRAGMLQLLLMAIGLAFVLRNGVQMIWGSQPRTLDVEVTAALTFLGLRIGETELLAVVLGLSTLVVVALVLRFTSLGKQMRALADNLDLAETTGINTGRVIIATWIFAAGLAGLAGVLVVAATGSLNPNTGFFLLLALFASVILGGIGNAFGALAGGLVIGLAQEWSTLVIAAQWKVAVSFVILILVLILRPQGIFGREQTL